MSKILSINKVKSVSNVLPEMGRGPEYPVSCINMDIENDLSLKTRDRFKKIHTVTNPHSLFEGEYFRLFRAGDSLYRILPDNATITEISTGFTTGLPLDYEEVNGEVYFSDGVASGIYDGVTTRSWGISPPKPPSLSEINGFLKKGTYRVKVSLVNYRQQESGLSSYDEIALTSDNKGIRISITDIPTDDISQVNFYITDKDSGRFTFYGYKYVDGNTSVSIDYTEQHIGRSLPLTEHLTPPPEGHKVCYFMSRIAIAVYNAIFYTEPLAYELCDLKNNFVQLPDFINNLISMDRLLIATTRNEMYIIDEDWRAKVAYKGSIIGNSAVVMNASLVNENWFGLGVVIASEEGLLFVLGDKSVINLSGKIYNFEGLSSAKSACLRNNKYTLNL